MYLFIISIFPPYVLAHTSCTLLLPTRPAGHPAGAAPGCDAFRVPFRPCLFLLYTSAADKACWAPCRRRSRLRRLPGALPAMSASSTHFFCWQGLLGTLLAPPRTATPSGCPSGNVYFFYTSTLRLLTRPAGHPVGAAPGCDAFLVPFRQCLIVLYTSSADKACWEPCRRRSGLRCLPGALSAMPFVNLPCFKLTMST